MLLTSNVSITLGATKSDTFRSIIGPAAATTPDVWASRVATAT